jgi:transmembrane sensor
MSSNVDWDLLAMYVLGECSADQKRIVERWLADDPLHSSMLDEVREAYDKAGKTPDERVRAEQRQEQTWAHIRAHMQQTAGTPRRGDSTAAPGRPARPRRAAHRLGRAASLVVATLAIVAFALALASQWQPGLLAWFADAEVKTFVTQRGERATIRLADSTRIRLNADSRLEVRPGFEAGRREVELWGEAYFEVAPDVRRPFLVHATGATTEVLGTAFAVRSYADETEVVVAEGKVAVRPSTASSPRARTQGGRPRRGEGATRGEVVLVPRQSARLALGGQPVVREVNLDSQLAWLSGALAFEDATFDEVSRRLERRYDIDIRLDGTGVRRQMTARFSEDQPLENVLTGVALVFGLDYRREGTAVTFWTPE